MNYFLLMLVILSTKVYAEDKQKVDNLLLHVYAQQTSKTVQRSNNLPPENQLLTPVLPTVTKTGCVYVDAVAIDNTDALKSDLKALGATEISAYGKMVSACMPVTSIPNLNSVNSLNFVRPAIARVNAGSITSQGDRSLRANVARANYGNTGVGVVVGTLSDSYNCKSGASAGVASGDLPSGYKVKVLANGPCPGSDEGRAMMEIIRDVAPGARQAFHTAFRGQADFAAGIIRLANSGATVINDDVFYFAEPMFQDGVIAQAVNKVRARGVTYLSAAGNDADHSYQSPFRAVNGQFPNGNLHDFDPGAAVDACQRVSINPGVTWFTFQWDQPHFSVSGSPGSASDMDVFLYASPDCSGNPFSTGESNNIGVDPIEVFGVQFSGSNTIQIGLEIKQFSGPFPGLMKYVVLDNGLGFSVDEFGTPGTSTVFGHANASGAIAVGAVDYHNTPAFGAIVPIAEDFSSHGGTPILFNVSGNRLASPLIFEKPLITAPDGGDTTFFGFDSDATGYPNFFGTSAGAPHGAGVVALMRSRSPNLTPNTTASRLSSTAIDMDAVGFDFATGHGLVQADAALASVTPVSRTKCKGKVANIVGTQFNDVISGTNGPDIIAGLGGNDTIHGLSGNDIICGNNGKDKLYGDAGKDQLVGGSSKDTCNGGSGVDSGSGCEVRKSIP